MPPNFSQWASTLPNGIHVDKITPLTLDASRPSPPRLRRSLCHTLSPDADVRPLCVHHAAIPYCQSNMAPVVATFSVVPTVSEETREPKGGFLSLLTPLGSPNSFVVSSLRTPIDLSLS